MDQPGTPTGNEPNTEANQQQQQQGASDIAAPQTIHDDSPDLNSAFQHPSGTDSKSDSASQFPTPENSFFSVSEVLSSGNLFFSGTQRQMRTESESDSASLGLTLGISSFSGAQRRMRTESKSDSASLGLTLGISSLSGVQRHMRTDSKSSDSAAQGLTSEISFSSGVQRPTQKMLSFLPKYRPPKTTDSKSDSASEVLTSEISSTEWPAVGTSRVKPIKPIEFQRDDVSELTEVSDVLPPPSIGSEPRSNSGSQFLLEFSNVHLPASRSRLRGRWASRFLSEVSDAIPPLPTGSEPRSNPDSQVVSEVSHALPPRLTGSEPRSNWASQFPLDVSDELPPRSTESKPHLNWASQFTLGLSAAIPPRSTGFGPPSNPDSQFLFLGTPSTGPTNLIQRKGKAIENHLDGNSVGLVIKAVLTNWFQNSSDVACQYQDHKDKGKGTAVEKTVDSDRTAAECLDCLAYCNLFPMGYEIERDDLVQLWMAVGLIEQEPMEFFALAYLDAIRSSTQKAGLDFISLTRADCTSGEEWYKFQAYCPGLTTTNTEGHFRALFGDQPLNLDSVSSFDQVRTLLLSQGHRSSQIDDIPYGFFVSLEHLRALDLSGTKMSELPSSVGSAKSLRYLNLSETLIQELPETICFLPNLQTLKLRNCSRLVALPEAMGMITSLRHLDLGPLCDLSSMPPKMGALTRLSTLSNFIVGTESGCCIGELKNLNNLRGKVSLSRLENVRSVDEAKEAQLQHKPNITKLELRWTDSLEWENVDVDDCEEVIHHLQPPKGLRDLDILCYGGSRFPTWISLPCFDKLTSIILFKCENCQFIPSLGQLPSLESLTLIELVQVRIMDLNCVETTTPYHDNFVAFPKLLRLEMESMLRLEEWREMGNTDYFPCLTKLVIKDCPHLATLCRLSNVRCLEYLELNYCGKLLSLPEGGLPVSVKKFVIDDCPLLCSSCNNSLEVEQGWHKTEHTSGLVIYNHISP